MSLIINHNLPAGKAARNAGDLSDNPAVSVRSSSRLKVHFGAAGDKAADGRYVINDNTGASAPDMDDRTEAGLAGYTVPTRAAAHKKPDVGNRTGFFKDNIRAGLGAMHNRPENEADNLRVQTENLQAAGSRISDMDVSLEMTEFVRTRILSQTAVAVLSQPGRLPGMALSLISM